jgi:hypothetical protein
VSPSSSRGAIEGNRLVRGPQGETPVKLRFTREVLDERPPTWKNEVSVAGGPWRLIETYTHALGPSAPSHGLPTLRRFAPFAGHEFPFTYQHKSIVLKP